jgi:hypothetical protein
MSDSSNPGRGLLGWLGRQVGYISKAIKADVGAPKIVYRNDSVEELPHPDDPSLKLRRTVIDEVVKTKPPAEDPSSSPGD